MRLRTVFGHHAQQFRSFVDGYIRVRRNTPVGAVGILGSNCRILFLLRCGPCRCTSPGAARALSLLAFPLSVGF